MKATVPTDLPTRPEAEALLARYTATKIRLMRSSPAFELTLCRDGKPVARVVNNGRGGCHDWSPVYPKGRRSDAAVEAAYATLDAVQTQITQAVQVIQGDATDYEAADHVVAGLADGAKDGLDALHMFLAVMAQYEQRDQTPYKAY